MTPDNSLAFLFDDVRVEPATFRAFKAGKAIQLEPKALRLLFFLIENRARLIEKEEILKAIWNGTHVTENALAQEIARLRKTLGDDPKSPKYIQTVHTRGYRFIAEVEVRSGLDCGSTGNARDFAPAAQVGGDKQQTMIEAVTQQQATNKSWVKRFTVAGIVIALAIAGVLAWKTHKPSTSMGATLPLSIRQITTGPGLDFNPAFSPDEQSLAYSSDHTGNFEIFVKSLAPGGRETQLTNDAQQNFDPAWSPDGRRIAYYSMKRHGIFVMPAFGGVSKQISEFGSHPVWSSDGQWLAFQSVSSPDLGALPVGNSMIWIVSSQGGTPKQITRADGAASRNAVQHLDDQCHWRQSDPAHS